MRLATWFLGVLLIGISILGCDAPSNGVDDDGMPFEQEKSDFYLDDLVPTNGAEIPSGPAGHVAYLMLMVYVLAVPMFVVASLACARWGTPVNAGKMYALISRINVKSIYRSIDLSTNRQLTRQILTDQAEA